MEDKFVLGGKEFKSRFILGSGKYNLNLIKAAVEQGGAEIITLALRRANTQESENILDFIPEGVTLLPNTSGARTAEEAVRIAADFTALCIHNTYQDPAHWYGVKFETALPSLIRMLE